jgi:hypothetical protein
MLNNVIPLLPYEVHEYPWCSAIKKRNGKWEKIFIKPDAQEIDVSKLDVIIHENGVEII